MQLSHGALLVFLDESGAPEPVGSTATLRATGAIIPVGYDGAAYVLDLKGHNDRLVETPAGKRCEIHFDYRPLAGDITKIGPLSCETGLP